jgi:hypothetical protein
MDTELSDITEVEPMLRIAGKEIEADEAGGVTSQYQNERIRYGHEHHAQNRSRERQ